MAADVNLLADLPGHVRDRLLDGVSACRGEREQGVTIGGPVLEHQVGDLVREGLEILVARHEVRFAVYLDENTRLAIVRRPGDDQAFLGLAVCPLRGDFLALLAK